MTYNRAKHHRRSIRLRGYDYTRPGAYFVTIVTQNRACLFGEVVDGEMRLNEYGKVVYECWTGIPAHSPNATVDEFIVMPNHVHGIIVLTAIAATHAMVGATHASPLRAHGPKQQSVASIVGAFKSATAKRINALRGTPGSPVWQRNYYEHIIRDETSLNRICQYILDNPAHWATDRENPQAKETEPEYTWTQ